MPVTRAWFCAGHYIKIKNIAEDYAYKTVLAESIVGFSEQLKDSDDNKIYQDYMEKMLTEIHHHLLKNHKKHEKTSAYDDLYSKFVSLVKNKDSAG